MTTIELKKNFHALIDKINNEVLLKKFYNILLLRSQAKDEALWNKLTTEEKEELLASEEESNYETNLVSHQDMKKKHEKWLKK